MTAEPKKWPSDREWHEDLQRKLDACRLLLQIADSLTERGYPGKPQVTLEEWARATKTYRATLSLAEGGFGQQAQVLSRSIFESWMLIAWALRRPEEADEQAQLHTLLALDLHRAARQTAGYWPGDPKEEFLTPAERKRAVELFGRRGTAYWSGHRQLKELVDEVLAPMDDDHEAAQLRAHFAVVASWADRMTHPSGISTRSHRAEYPDHPESREGGLVIITGPSRHQVFDALWAAYAAYLPLLDEIVGRWAPEMETKLERAAGLLWRAWKNPAELEGLADDDPCPCDRAGTRWGDCHKWTEALELGSGPQAKAPPRPRKRRRSKRSRRKRK